MSDHDDSHTVQTLDGALRGAEVGGRTRRWLLERAAVGAAGVAAGAALAPGGSAAASNGGNSVPAFGRVAVTTEALTVVLLTELLRRVDRHPEVPAAAKAVIEGAYAAEVDHLRFTSENWRPTTTTFWIPDGIFGGSGDALDLAAFGQVLLASETLFVNLYLIGVTVFARESKETFARYAAELAGCEAEHRVLAASLVGVTPADDVGFEVYSIDRPDGIQQALEQAGVGFGAQGAAPGAFYTLTDPVMTPPVQIRSNSPAQRPSRRHPELSPRVARGHSPLVLAVPAGQGTHQGYLRARANVESVTLVSSRERCPCIRSSCHRTKER